MSRLGKMHNFENNVLGHIRDHSLLGPGMQVLVAVSGGGDSVALLLALQALAGELGTTVTAAHVNHQLRGRESDGDEAFVQQLCQRMGVPLQIGRCPIESTTGPGNLENQARLLRYKFLCRLAGEQSACVATGHTLNDQAETFLMKLVRGAGPTGLSGIYPRRSNPLRLLGDTGSIVVIRPLLQCTREEVTRYLAQKGQDFRSDASNLDTALDRNWVRGQLIPQLEDRLNPKLTRTLGRTAALFLQVEEFLEQEASKARIECSSQKGNDFQLSLTKLKCLTPILQKTVIRQILLDIRGTLHGIRQGHLEDVLALAEKISGKQIHLPGNLKVEREFEQLIFRTQRQSKPFSYRLQVPGELWLEEVGKRVSARRVNTTRDATRAVCLLYPQGPLMLRSRRPGDRYQLASGSPTRKLKKILIDRRVPRYQRDRLLVLQADREVVWVEGFLPHPAFRPREGVRDLLEIEIRCPSA